jgi:hypothetical protein
MYGDFDDTNKELDLDAGLSQFVQIYMPARNFATRTREEYRSDLEDLAAFLKDRRILTWTVVGLQDLHTSWPIWTAGVLSPHPAITRPNNRLGQGCAIHISGKMRYGQ